MTSPELIEIPIESIAANPLNRRRAIDPRKLEELADSIRQHGILQPILVRLNPKGGKKTPYQLVIGERRWRAAKLAGLESVRTTVRAIDDAECLEIILVENGRRDDLDALEEAETYEELRSHYGYSLERIAERVGKSKTSVFQRIALTRLEKPILEALREGRIEVSVAELIARAVHPRQQAEALVEVQATDYQSAMSYREARRHVEQAYTLRLASVPWTLEDAALVPEAGPCTTCPKRTGNQPELFGTETGKDVCLDRACFDGKTAAARRRRLEQAASDGATVLEDAAAAKVLDRYHGVKATSGYVDLGEAVPSATAGGKVRSLRQVLGKKALPPVTILADPQSDRIVEVVRRDDAVKALKAKGLSLSAPARVSSRSPAEKKREAVARFSVAVHDLEVAAIVAKVERHSITAGIPQAALRALAGEVLEAVWHDASEATKKRRGVAGDGHKLDGGHPLRPIIRDGKPGEVYGLLVELLAQRHRPRSYDRGGRRPFVASLAKAYRVDLMKIRSAAGRYVRALEKRRAAAATQKTARRKAGSAKPARKTSSRKTAVRKKARKKARR